MKEFMLDGVTYEIPDQPNDSIILIFAQVVREWLAGAGQEKNALMQMLARGSGAMFTIMLNRRLKDRPDLREQVQREYNDPIERLIAAEWLLFATERQTITIVLTSESTAHGRRQITDYAIESIEEHEPESDPV